MLFWVLLSIFQIKNPLCSPFAHQGKSHSMSEGKITFDQMILAIFRLSGVLGHS